MELEYQYLLELMGAYVTRRAPRIQPEADWEKLVQLANIHTVTGILGYMVMQYPICPDPKLSASLRQTVLATLMQYTQRMELCRQLSKSLNEAGIQHILMKGVVVREYYPVPELRTFGDIDLVIHPEDQEKCHALMLEAGFSPKVDWGCVYSYTRGPEFYEIHTDIMEVDVSEKADYRNYFRQMWQHTIPRADGSLEFSPEFHFLYQLTHIAKHIRGAGAGARMYLDLAACILYFGDRMDWDWIHRELEDLRLLEFASVALAAVENWFGVKCPMARNDTEQEVMDRFLIFTMEAGLYGYHDRERGVNALRRSGKVRTGSRLALLMRRSFPPVEQLQARYSYLQNKPWLLPVAWVHRLIKTRESLGRHAHEAQVILSADEEEVTWLRNVCRDIGL